MPHDTQPMLPHVPATQGNPGGTHTAEPAAPVEAPEDAARRERELVVRLTTFFYAPSDVL